ncbi:MAG TPA: tetratricopeptide repeat protein [Polyangiaceae bacterium]|nr:tetratricopeptide repeat protein [Polyangiaceae bacterium]
MEIDLLRAELERLFGLDELFMLSRELLGFEPETVGGTAGIGSFARALTEHCAEHDAVEALCDAVLASKSEVNPDVAALGARGISPRDDVLLGELFGPFLITRKLGEGPLGISYVAKQDDTEVRLKILRSEATRDQRTLRRFLTLTRLAARVIHPGLPWKLRTGFSEGRYYVVHEHVEGQALAARVARTGPMHINEARDLLRSTLEALEALHAERLVHGNVKLENVVLYRTADGNQRILLSDAAGDRLRARAPANGHVEPWSVSSPKTVAPERLRGYLPSPASDVYSFGALLYEVLAGKPPFATTSVSDAIVAHLTEVPPPPSAVAPRGWIARDLDQLVLRLLEKDPKARPESARAVLDLLEGFGRAEGTLTSSLSDDEVRTRIDALLADPTNEEAALSLESAVAEGADLKIVAETFVSAADTLTAGEDAARAAAVGLFFRAARLFQESLRDPERAERLYASILTIDPKDGTAQARLDEVRHRLGKHDELVESLLARSEEAAEGPERAALFAKIGGLYAKEMGDEEQALIALTQAFTEDPAHGEYAREIERLAGNDANRWGEALGSCMEASTGEQPTATKNRLFAQMGTWYEERLSRPDLALQCHSAILATDPSDEAALRGLAQLYRKAQQWSELAALLLRRADIATDPAKGRTLRYEAAGLFEHQLNDVGVAKDLYAQIVATDPGFDGAADALGRLLEQRHEYAELVKLLEARAATSKGDERRRALCRIAEVHEDRLNDDGEAARFYFAVLLDDEDNFDALRGLDRLHSKAGRFGDLLKNLEHQHRLAATPRQKIALLERVAAIHDEEFLDHEKAGDALAKILELDPAHAVALTELTRHYRALGRFEDVVPIYEQRETLAESEAERLELALAKAHVLGRELGAVDRAIVAYEHVLELDPESASALESLARLRETAGHGDAALAAIEALAERTETPEAKAEHFLRAAKLLEAHGDPNGAIERYKRALDATPKDVAIAAALRTLYVARGDTNAAIELLERQIADTDGDRQKAKLYAEEATLYRTKLLDEERAERTARRATDLDPTNTAAMSMLADIAFRGGRFVEAAALYEKLSSSADVLPRDEAVQVLERYVDALTQGGSTERALAAMDTLLRLAPNDRHALARVAAVTFEHGSAAKARELYGELLGVFDESLEPELKFVATYRVGEAARRSGNLDAALGSLESASELDPSSPLPLLALAKAYEQKEDWAKAVDAKTRHLDIAEGEERVRLLVEIGDLAATKLNDRALATKSLVAAVDERPDDRKLLTRLMQLYSEEKDWQKLVDIVLKLADFVDDPKQKAKYLGTAAMVAGHEIGDYDAALLYYGRVLELDPGNEKAVDDTIELLEQKGDYAGAVERLKEKATAASNAKDTQRMLEAFNRLAPIYKDKLGRVGHTADALEAAQTLEPDNAERNRALAELYALYPERFMDKAIGAQLAMLREDPYRVESYKLLRRLYTDAKRADAAFCLCQALYVLKLAEPDEERFFKRMRSEDPAYAKEVMSTDDWLEMLLHPDADPMLTSLFALIEPAIILSRAESWNALGYDPDFAIDPSEHPSPLAQTLHYAAGVLGIELPSLFENPNDPGGLAFLHAPAPSIVLGAAALGANGTPQSLAFVAGRHLAYYRPGFYIRHLVSATGLRSWLFAAIKMNAPQFPVAPDIEGSVNHAVAALERHITLDLRDHLARIVSRLIQSGAALDLRRWVQGVDLTTERAGFVLAHDLETAVELVRASDESTSSLTAPARLKELVLYAISEPYFKLRARLGIGVDT